MVFSARPARWPRMNQWWIRAPMIALGACRPWLSVLIWLAGPRARGTRGGPQAPRRWRRSARFISSSRLRGRDLAVAAGPLGPAAGADVDCGCAARPRGSTRAAFGGTDAIVRLVLPERVRRRAVFPARPALGRVPETVSSTSSRWVLRPACPRWCRRNMDGCSLHRVCGVGLAAWANRLVEGARDVLESLCAAVGCCSRRCCRASSTR